MTPVAGFKNIGVFVERISAGTSGCFRDIRSIANAYKHLYESTDPVRVPHSSVSSAGAIEAIEFTDAEDLQSMESALDVMPNGPPQQRVVYTRKDGARIEFLATLKAVTDYYYRDLWQV